MNFVCPYARQESAKGIILCSLLIKDGSDNSELKTKLKAYCAHQRYCTCKSKVVNSDGAEECYKQHKQ